MARYLALLLRGMRADPSAPELFPAHSLTREQLEDLFTSGALRKR